LLVAANLVDVDAVESGLFELIDRPAVIVGLRAADDLLGDLLRRQRLGRVAVVPR
jgi:hypothetical protein